MDGHARGFSLVDVIVGIALLLVMFLSLFSILRASLMLSALTKAQAAAVELANVQMEYLRGLSYDAIGTVGGIPAGNVPQYTTVVENDMSYTTYTFINFVDDPADGLYPNDTIPNDYKRARVSVSYTIGGQTKSVSLESNFAPPGIESSAGGGTLSIGVVDAAGNPVSDATVTIKNYLTNPTVDVTAFTTIDGQVLLGGAATSTAYQVSVMKTGYSSAQTYPRDTTNQNPNPGYLTVVKDQTTTGTFAIDRLATLNLATYAPIATSTFSDTFADASKLAAMSSTTVSGGVLALLSGETSGSARSVASSPTRLAHWGEATTTLDLPSGTTVAAHIYDGSGSLIPDTVLPGNAAGFTSFPILLYSVSTTTYPSLAIGADLSGDASSTPSIDAWSLSYTTGPAPIPNAAFTLTGTKTIGSTGAGAPIYKTVISAATNASGTYSLPLEWDGYSLTVPNYDIEDACPFPSYAVAPNTTLNASLFLAPPTTNYLDVLVTDNAGAIVPGALVTLSRTGYSKSVLSSSCGVAYFGGISSASDYTVTAVKSGYTTTSTTGTVVSGASSISITFP
ncbi:MAG: hypothetical protein ACYC48_01780 [Minisyncoccota bacterium]